jgi:hypothetical protein
VLRAEQAEAGHGTLNAIGDAFRPAIHAENPAGGTGIEASGGTGVLASGDPYAVDAKGYIGVQARGDEIGANCFGSVYGVQGFGAVGVRGHGGDTGVEGSSSFGDGVVGYTSENGAGVRAVALYSSSTATALHVEGVAKFSTAGSGTIGSRQDSGFIPNSRVTALSHITVTLTADPGTASTGGPAVVVWVERQPGSGFLVHLSRRVARDTSFTYLIVESAPT